jgi:hypothetical protein
MSNASGARWDERELANPCHLRNCAVCCGLPLDYPGFLRSFHESSNITLARAMEGNWREYNEQILTPLEAALRKFESEFGTTVLRRTTLDDLQTLSTTKDVIVVVTHWQSPAFTGTDILDPERFVQRTQSDEHWVACEVWNAIQARSARVWDIFGSDPLAHAKRCDQLADFIASALNDHIGSAEMTLETNGDEYFSDDRAAIRQRAGLASVVRLRIEDYFGDIIAPGKSMELSEGMASVWPLLLQPDTRSIVFDLSMCGSTEFSDMATLHRPRMRVIGRFERTNLPPCLLLLDRTFSILRQSHCSYLEARAEAMLDLNEHFRKLK